MEDQPVFDPSRKGDILGASSNFGLAPAGNSSCNCSYMGFKPRSRAAAGQETAACSEQAQRRQPLLVQRLLEDMRCRSPLERAALLHQQPSSLLASMALAISQQCVAAAVEARLAAIAPPHAPSDEMAAAARAAALQAAAHAAERAVWRMRVARKLALAALIKRSKEEQQARLPDNREHHHQQQQQQCAAHDLPSNRDHHHHQHQHQQQQQQQQLKRKREQEEDAAEGVGDSEEVVLAAPHVTSVLQRHALPAAAAMDS